MADRGCADPSLWVVVVVAVGVGVGGGQVNAGLGLKGEEEEGWWASISSNPRELFLPTAWLVRVLLSMSRPEDCFLNNSWHLPSTSWFSPAACIASFKLSISAVILLSRILTLSSS